MFVTGRGSRRGGKMATREKNVKAASRRLSGDQCQRAAATVITATTKPVVEIQNHRRFA